MIRQPMPGLTPEAGDKRYLKTEGGTMTGELDMGNNRITNLRTPLNQTDAIRQVDISLVNETGNQTVSIGGGLKLLIKSTYSLVTSGYKSPSGGYKLPIQVKNSSPSSSLTVNFASESNKRLRLFCADINGTIFSLDIQGTAPTTYSLPADTSIMVFACASSPL